MGNFSKRDIERYLITGKVELYNERLERYFINEELIKCVYEVMSISNRNKYIRPGSKLINKILAVTLWRNGDIKGARDTIIEVIKAKEDYKVREADSNLILNVARDKQIRNEEEYQRNGLAFSTDERRALRALLSEYNS
ncbi:hypothetical protein [Sulfurimonas sp.]